MLETLWDIFLDGLIDSLKTLPFLLAVYIFIEYVEHRSADKMGACLRKMGPFGAVGGGLLGCVPQCGFSVIASNLFTGRLITMGTLVAVFISTSDEAIPLIVANPSSTGILWKLILIKTLLGISVGVVVDLVLKALGKQNKDEPYVDICKDCDCEHHGIIHSAIHHTVEILIFIFIINLLLNGFMEFAGEDTVRKVLMHESFFQPLIAGIIGFIPNCAASVVLTQLYIDGVVSFGSIIAGLTTGAGIGLAVLFKTNKRLKENFLIMGILYIAGCAAGIIIDLF